MEKLAPADFSGAIVNFNPFEKSENDSQNIEITNLGSMAGGIPPSPSGSKTCDRLKRASYLWSAAAGISWTSSAISTENARAGNAFMSVVMTGTAGIQWTHYLRSCRGPNGPQDSRPPEPTPTVPSPQQDSNPIRSVDGAVSWENFGWGLAGGLLALGAAALLFVPFDGPVGEAALGSASLAAFANAGF